LGQNYTVARRDMQNPSIYRMAFYGHPYHSGYRDAAAASIDVSDGRIFTPKEKVVANLYGDKSPSLTPQQLSTAIIPSTGYRIRMLDIGTYNDAPSIAYAIWKGTAGNATYKVKRWTESGWKSAPWQLSAGREFGYKQEIHYLGGMVFAPGGGLVTARQYPPGVTNGTWYVEHWVKDDEGYDKAQTLMQSSARHVRPYAVRAAGRIAVMFQRLLRYDGYKTYHADIEVYW
jgi:hypothetical protein